MYIFGEAFCDILANDFLRDKWQVLALLEILKLALDFSEVELYFSQTLLVEFISGAIFNQRIQIRKSCAKLLLTSLQLAEVVF